VADVVNQAADELYGLPPGEFTRARDTRAKEVRKDGDREAADAIKALRKPTVAAWALNQLARRRAKDVKRLVKAGEDLRAAQQELLAGGDRGAFQEVAAKERELVADLSSDASAMATEAGERGSGLQEKIAETLHAAALDEGAAEELSAGRLVREREAIGGFGGAGDGPAPSPRNAKAKPKGKSAEKSPSKAARGKASAEQRQRLSAARTDERHARRELDAAARALEHAQERADAAEAAAAEAAKRARTTKERLQEAKRAAAAAKKAHGRAKRALETAEKR
jgi:hypothetical protein